MTVRARSGLALGMLLLAPLCASAGSRLVFPRVIFQQGRFTGIAVANPSASDAPITLTAYNSDGTPYSASGVGNPRSATVKSGAQYSKLASEIFTPPDAVLNSPSAAPLWVEVTSAVDGLTGFYLEGDNNLGFLDGSRLSGSGSDLVLPLVDNVGGSTTEVSIVNPDASGPANIAVDLVDESGVVVHSHTAGLGARAALHGSISTLFPGAYATVRTMRLRSDRPVLCFGFVFRQPENSLVTLAASIGSAPARTLYFPQLAQGDSWFTTLGLVNLKATKTLVTITAYRGDGTLFSAPEVRENPVSRVIPAGGSLRAGLNTLFGFGDSALLSGWIKVEADNPALTGFVEYGAGTNRALVAAQIETITRAIFSHQATQSPYYTGFAVLNPSTLVANVELVSLSPAGQLLGKTKRALGPGKREAVLIQQWIPGTEGAVGGSIFLKSDQPVVATQLFGTDTFSALANVPPQPLSASFDPAATTPSLKVGPPMAVVETGKAFKFTASGSAVGDWKVGDVPGGTPSSGTVTNSGLFTAPARVPAQHNQAVQAVSVAGDQSSAATVDVVQREVLTSSLTLLTAVAYLKNIQRFFVAEQQLIASAATGARVHASAANTRISEVTASAGAQPFLQIPNETVSKMIPDIDTAGASHLLIAGRDSGTIYRLDVANRRLTAVARGLNQPSSLALDPITGSLFVSEEGANQITVIARSQLEAAAAPAGVPAAEHEPRRAAVPSPTGVAFDKCTGALYVTSNDGVLREFLQNREREVIRDLDMPGQILVLMRQGMPSCYEAVTLFVAERTRVVQVDPRRGEAISFLEGTNDVQDLGFFDRKSRFVQGGEESVVVAEGPQNPGASRVLLVGVGGLYQEEPLDATISGGLEFTPAGGSSAYQDRINDTFATALSVEANLEVPDLTSISVHSLGNANVVTLNFTAPVAPAALDAPNSITGWIDFDTLLGTGVRSHADDYRPLRPETAGTDYSLDLSTGILTQTRSPGTSSGEGAPPVVLRLDFLNNTVSVVIPRALFDALRSRVSAAVGNLAEITEIAPEYEYAFINAQAAGARTVQFADMSSRGTEAASPVTIDVVLSSPSTEPVSVNYAATTGTAAGSDCTLSPGTLTFAPGETLKTLSFAVVNDPLDEPDETVAVSLSAPVNATLGAQATHTYTITDDDSVPAVQFSTVASSALESVAAVDLAVSLSTPSAYTVTVSFAVTGGSAAGEGSDYSLSPGTLTFAPGETLKTLSFAVVNDPLDEPGETVAVSLAAPVNASLGAQATHTYTILDDDSVPAVQFSSAVSSGPESVAAVDLAVSLSAPSTATVTVSFAVTGGSATGGGSDYSLSPGTLTFAPGETLKTLSFAVVNDPLDEPDETVAVSLAAPVNATLGAQATHTYTILDDDSVPAVQFSTVASSGPESVAAVDLAVSLSAPSTATVTVNYAVIGGTAAGGGSDYSLSPGTLTFAPGETLKTLSFAVVNDSLDEPDETVAVSLAAPVNATLGAQATHTYTILDEDSAPAVQFSTVASSGPESVAAVDLAVSLSAPSTATVTVSFAVTGGTAAGGGSDYSLSPGTLTFAPGETLKTLSFAVVNDPLDEPDETVAVSLSAPVNATLGAQATHTYTIADDDSVPAVQFSSAVSSGPESVAAVDLSVSLSAPSTATVTVSFAVTGGSATGGGSDYSLSPGTLTFAPGETLKTLSFAVVNDSLDEPDETVAVSLAAPVNATLGAQATHTYTILDEDSAPAVQFSTVASSGPESVAAVDLAVSLSAPSTATVTVNYAVIGGTAAGGGSDYSLSPGTLTFAPGETLKTLSFAVVNDPLDEPDETVAVSLSAPVNATLGAQATHTYTIADDDSVPAVQFSSAVSSGPESVAAVDLAVSLSAPSTATVTVSFAVTGGSATGGGSDYSLSPGTLTFAPGETLKTLSFAVVNDSLDEPDETVAVSLSAPVNATLGAQATHTYTIADEDAAPVVRFSTVASSALESIAAIDFSVSLSAPSAQTVTVDFALAGGTATGQGVDYSLVIGAGAPDPSPGIGPIAIRLQRTTGPASGIRGGIEGSRRYGPVAPIGSLQFPPGDTVKSIRITVVDDGIPESSETIVYALTRAVNATIGSPSAHIHTILDNDGVPSPATGLLGSRPGNSETQRTPAPTAATRPVDPAQERN